MDEPSSARRPPLLILGRSLRGVAADAFALAFAYWCLRDLGGVAAYGLASGVATAVTLASYALTGLLARHDPRRVTIVALVAQSVALAALGLQVALAAPSLLATTCLFSLAAFANAVAEPLDIALVAMVGEWHEARRGRTIAGSIWGPALARLVALWGGGLATSLLGAGTTILLAALANAAGTAAIALAAGLRGAHPHTGSDVASDLRGEFGAALRTIRSTRWLAWRFFVYVAFWPFLATALLLIPARAIELGLPASDYGLLAALAAGLSGLGLVRLAGWLRAVRPTYGVVLGLPALRVASLGLVGLAPGVAPFAAALALSASSSNLNHAAWTANFARIPPERRSMVSAVDWFSSTVLQALLTLTLPLWVAIFGTAGALCGLAGVALAGILVSWAVAGRNASG